MNERPARTNEGGFTLIEVMIAIMILTVGLLAMAGSSGGATRMIGYGKRGSQVAQVANRRLELLLMRANATTPRCGSLANGSVSAPSGVSEAWTITGAGATRSVREIVTVRTPRATNVDTVSYAIACN